MAWRGGHVATAWARGRNRPSNPPPAKLGRRRCLIRKPLANRGGGRRIREVAHLARALPLLGGLAGEFLEIADRRAHLRLIEVLHAQPGGLDGLAQISRRSRADLGHTSVRISPSSAASCTRHSASSSPDSSAHSAIRPSIGVSVFSPPTAPSSPTYRRTWAPIHLCPRVRHAGSSASASAPASSSARFERGKRAPPFVFTVERSSLETLRAALALGAVPWPASSSALSAESAPSSSLTDS